MEPADVEHRQDQEAQGQGLGDRATRARLDRRESDTVELKAGEERDKDDPSFHG